MSLKGDKYESVEEASRRLQSTVVLYDGEPVYITNVTAPAAGDEDRTKDDIFRVWFHSLPHSKSPQQRKYISSKKFDLTPFPMGYVNLQNAAHHVCRSPRRQGLQGLSSGNSVITTLSNNPVPIGRRYGAINFEHLIDSDAFIRFFFKKQFPELKEAMDNLSKGHSSCALSTSAAITMDEDFEMMFAHHNGVKCGFAMKGDKGLTIPDKFKFLKEELEECRIPIK